MRITVAYLLNFEYCYCVVLIGYMTTGGNCKSAISARRFESVLFHRCEHCGASDIECPGETGRVKPARTGGRDG